MTNPEGEKSVLLRYHETTKHSYWSVRSDPHYLDWANKPLLFKTYTSLDPIPLPREVTQSGVATLSAIGEQIRPPNSGRIDLQSLARILYFSYGITKTRQYPGGEIHFRAAACTGALYEFELYLVTGELQGLDAGVYHFSSAEFALRKLRSGDFRKTLITATASHPAIVHAPLTIVCAGTYWRNAWKYQARTYRHFGWDNGMIAANMMAMATAQGLPIEVISGFLDSAINDLLSLDTSREVAFSLIPIGYESLESPASPPIPALSFETLPLSASEVRYPLMNEAHEASSFSSTQQIRNWQSQFTPELTPQGVQGAIDLVPLEDDHSGLETLEQTILKRGSTRKFARSGISLQQLSTMLDRATRGFRADFHHPSAALMNELYLLVHDVDGLQPGAYYFNRAQHSLDLLKGGDFRNEGAYLGLEQELAGDASVDVFFMVNLPLVLNRYGDRGYRAVQLEAGVLGGKLYLASYAQKLGATGLTFYDDNVTDFFSPHAAEKSPIFMMCLGRSAKQSSSG